MTVRRLDDRGRQPPLGRTGAVWRRWLPAGRELAEADFARRHRSVCALLAVHLPVLLALAVARPDTGLGDGTLLVLPALALLGAALLPLRRRLRSCAAATGLLACSAVLLVVTGGAPAAHLHTLLAVAVIALYQAWVPLALAVAVVGGFTSLVETRGPEAAWVWPLTTTGAVLAEVAVLGAFWHAHETARAEQERMGEVLASGQSSVRASLEQADRIRTDLIGTVSHEFRTPLTGIRGAALTLLKRGDRLDGDARASLLHAVLDQQERLSRLLENMLTAAQATATDPTAAAEVDAVAAEVAMLAGATRPQCPAVSLVVEPRTQARIDRQALHQVLANLVDNAQQHGATDAVPLVAGGTDDRGVWVTISNEGTTLAPDQARDLFMPFTQLDSGVTREREGLGMGLYVVKRLVEVYGGTVEVRSEGGWTTVELRLEATPHEASITRLPA